MEEGAASGSVPRPSGQRDQSPAPSGPDFSTEERTPKSFLGASGGSKRVHLDLEARDPTPLGPQILHSLALHVVTPSYPLLKTATKICSFSSPGRENPLAYLISQALATQKETPKPYRLGRARL